MNARANAIQRRFMALVVIVDEAQLLDAQFKPTPDTAGGARLAARVLRELQVSLSKIADYVVLVPLLLGTNPDTVITDPTLGRNVVWAVWRRRALSKPVHWTSSCSGASASPHPPCAKSTRMGTPGTPATGQLSRF